MKSFKKKFLKKKHGKCAICGSEKKLTIDHIIPKSKGGTGRWKNLQVLCKSCNVKKGNKMPSSYPQQDVAVIIEEDIINSLAGNNNKFMMDDQREAQAKRDLAGQDSAEASADEGADESAADAAAKSAEADAAADAGETTDAGASQGTSTDSEAVV